MKNVIRIILAWFTILFVISCNDSAKKNIVENNYKKLFDEYLLDLSKGKNFSFLVDNYFYEYLELKKDTSLESSFFYNKLENEILVMFLSDEYNSEKYYWAEDILNSRFANDYNSKCDCQLLIESRDQKLEIFICFYKEKIYSLTGEYPNIRFGLEKLNN